MRASCAFRRLLGDYNPRIDAYDLSPSGEGVEVGAVRSTELLTGVDDVPVNGMRGDAELRSNGLISKPPPEGFDNLAFAARETSFGLQLARTALLPDALS
jgi:hypothetical protein